MKVDSEVRTLCDGRGCEALSVGTLHELKLIPRWRRPDDRPVNHAQFDLVATVHYCAEHEDTAKAYQHQFLRAIYPDLEFGSEDRSRVADTSTN